MYILLFWAITNVVLGMVLARFAKGAWRHFGVFSAGWNVVNLALALSAVVNTTLLVGFRAQAEEAFFLQGLFAVNAGLDVAYITAGFWLWDRSRWVERNRERNRGYGWALWLQGGFLLVFDSAMWYHTHQGFHALFMQQ